MTEHDFELGEFAGLAERGARVDTALLPSAPNVRWRIGTPDPARREMSAVDEDALAFARAVGVDTTSAVAR